MKNLYSIVTALLEATPLDDKTGTEWAVTILQVGESQNQNSYSGDVIQRDGPLFEGVPVHAAVGKDHSAAERGVLSIVGYIKDVKATSESVTGTLHVSDPVLRARMLDWWTEGILGRMLGLSISAVAETRRNKNGGTEVTRIVKPESVDLVRAPAAGGRIDNLIESKIDEQDTEEPKQEGAMTDEERKALIVEIMEALKVQREAQEAEEKKVEEMDDHGDDDKKKKADAEKKKKEEEADKKKKDDDDKKKKMDEAVLPSYVVFGQEAALTQVLEQSKLPEHSAKRVREMYPTSKMIDFEVVKETIKNEKNYLAAHEKRVVESITKQGVIVPGSVTVDEMDKKVARWTATFEPTQNGYSMIKIGESAEESRVEPYISFKEAYMDWTGENPYGQDSGEKMWKSFLGISNFDSAVRTPRKQLLSEAVGLTTAAQSSATAWGEVAADVMYQSFVQNYQNQPRYNEWRKVARIGRATDFRPQHRIKIGEYADLGAVTENLQYPDITHPGTKRARSRSASTGISLPGSRGR